MGFDLQVTDILSYVFTEIFDRLVKFLFRFLDSYTLRNLKVCLLLLA